MGCQHNRHFRVWSIIACLLSGMTQVGCHQLTPRPVATFNQPPVYQYSPATPNYSTPTPDPAYGTPTPVEPYGAARPVSPATPDAAQPSLSGRPLESYNRRVPTPVDPPDDSPTPSNSFVGPVLAPPTDLPESESKNEMSSLFPEAEGTNDESRELDRTLPQPKTKPANLDLSVRVSANHQLGAAIEYKLRVENIGELTANEVTIEAEFDDALIFPGRSDKRVRKVLGDFAGGQSQDIPLTLTADEAGVHCARFTISGDGLTPVTKQVCVTISGQSTARVP